jgi:hypothetical protein
MTQIAALYPYWPAEAEWFVIGGPACELEAQEVHSKFPHMKCVGFEPNEEACRKQNTELAFPGVVHPYALWSETADLTLMLPGGFDPKRASVCAPENRPDFAPEAVVKPFQKTIGKPLDSLSDLLGPFTNAVLWIDIEFAELAALQGATKLLDQVLLINLESFFYRPDFVKINRLLTHRGFVLQQVWNMGERTYVDAQDYIYAREDINGLAYKVQTY